MLKDQNKNTTIQTYYHSDKEFDYEKFFSSIFSFALPLVEGESIRFTTIFIFEGEHGKPYAKYRIPYRFKKDKDFRDEASFLENYKLDLLDESNSEFSVFKIFKDFSKLKPDEESGPLNPINLDRYFGEKPKKSRNPEK